MDKLIIPEYENFLNNEIFLKHSKSKSAPVTLMRVNKFLNPTLKEIQENIVFESKRLFYYVGEEENYEVNAVTEILKAFPKEILKELQNTNSKEMKFLKSKYEESFLQEGAQYLDVVRGKIPSELVEALKIFEIIPPELKEPEFYESLLNKYKLGEISDIFIRLEGNKLPDKKEIDFLLSQQVRTSAAITFLNNPSKYKKAKEELQLIYDLNFNNYIPLFPDYSKKQMESRSCKFLEELVNVVNTEEMIENISNLVRKIIQKDLDSEDSQKGKGDISLN